MSVSSNSPYSTQMVKKLDAPLIKDPTKGAGIKHRVKVMFSAEAKPIHYIALHSFKTYETLKETFFQKLLDKLGLKRWVYIPLGKSNPYDKTTYVKVNKESLRKRFNFTKEEIKTIKNQPDAFINLADPNAKSTIAKGPSEQTQPIQLSKVPSSTQPIQLSKVPSSSTQPIQLSDPEAFKSLTHTQLETKRKEILDRMNNPLKDKADFNIIILEADQIIAEFERRKRLETEPKPSAFQLPIDSAALKSLSTKDLRIKGRALVEQIEKNQENEEVRSSLLRQVQPIRQELEGRIQATQALSDGAIKKALEELEMKKTRRQHGDKTITTKALLEDLKKIQKMQEQQARQLKQSKKPDQLAKSPQPINDKIQKAQGWTAQVKSTDIKSPTTKESLIKSSATKESLKTLNHSNLFIFTKKMTHDTKYIHLFLPITFLEIDQKRFKILITRENGKTDTVTYPTASVDLIWSESQLQEFFKA